MNYYHTYPNVTIRYYASNVCLHIEFGASYLVQPREHSRVVGHIYLSNYVPQNIKTPQPKPNGPIIIEYCAVRNVISSAEDAETIVFFHNAKIAVPIRTALSKLSHVQPPTTMRDDNSTSHVILTSTIQQK